MSSCHRPKTPVRVNGVVRSAIAARFVFTCSSNSVSLAVYIYLTPYERVRAVIYNQPATPSRANLLMPRRTTKSPAVLNVMVFPGLIERDATVTSLLCQTRKGCDVKRKFLSLKRRNGKHVGFGGIGNRKRNLAASSYRDILVVPGRSLCNSQRPVSASMAVDLCADATAPAALMVTSPETETLLRSVPSPTRISRSPCSQERSGRSMHHPR